MFPSINVKHDIDRMGQWALAMAAEQLPFATALALTRTASDAANELTRELPKHLDKPTPFTMRAFSVARADKRTLTAAVFAKDAQAAYLRWQVDGGSRPPSKVAQRLPNAIKLNDFGNIPRGEIARLIKLAQAGQRLTRARGRRLAISSKVDLFYGDPGNGMPPGVFKRVVQGTEHKLIPLVVFPKQAAQYKARLPMHAIVERVVRDRFPANFSAALDQALRSAR
jgi:hypothetical protein